MTSMFVDLKNQEIDLMILISLSLKTIAQTTSEKQSFGKEYLRKR